MASEGRKDDNGKPRWDLLPVRAVSSMVEALTYGANRYGDNNWRMVPDGKQRYLGATLRHLVQWWLGNRIDPDSGVHHLGCAMASIGFMYELTETLRKDEQDDDMDADEKREEVRLPLSLSGRYSSG